MKLKFKIQNYQTQAVEAVTNLFIGQERKAHTFNILQDREINILYSNLGAGNLLTISEEQILENMNNIQVKNNLPKTNSIDGKQFSIEMETGTGKTYVYIKTIFELNKKFGFMKFIIVVPSVAIREGVYKTLQVTQEHFALNYDNVPNRFFIYDSSKLSTVRDFATNTDIEIMIINIDAFKKSENIINQEQDKLNGETAMSYIRDTNSIVIIDEPQSVDNTLKSKEAIKSLNPLAVIKYSATHREKINLLYRLTPVDAYQKNLVKQIHIASDQVKNEHNKPYIKLLSVSNSNGFSAKIEMDIANIEGVVLRKPVKVKQGAKLYAISGERELYKDYIIAGIDCTNGFESIDFTNGDKLMLYQSFGDVDINVLKKNQIRTTIEIHLEKELCYYEKGIKVISLFFIDEVKKYRKEDGSNGQYAEMFEEVYNELVSLSKFQILKDRFSGKCHNGYFSQDRKGIYKNTKGDTLADYDTYNMIMKDKEWLLSFNCPLRFIFSHSALKEGWDNPNIFQVCTLTEQKSTLTCRQKIGRGLRLCVNQEGDRIEDKNINILHVIANESFLEFAGKLQKEIEEETGMKFGVLDIEMFVGVSYNEQKNEIKVITKEETLKLIEHLESRALIDKDGVIKEEFISSVEKDILILPKELEPTKYIIKHAVENETIFNRHVIEGKNYVTVTTKEKKMTYQEAKMLVKYFEDKGYITKEGQIRAVMKEALKKGTFDLPEKFESAKEKLESIIRRTDERLPIYDARKDVDVKLKKEVIVNNKEFKKLWNKIKQKNEYRIDVSDEEIKRLCVVELKKMDTIPKAKIVTEIGSLDLDKAQVKCTKQSIRTVDLKQQAHKLPDFLKIVDNECFISKSLYVEILEESGHAQSFLNNPQLFIEKFIECVNSVRSNLEIQGVSYTKLEGQEYFIKEIFDVQELRANKDERRSKENQKIECSKKHFEAIDSGVMLKEAVRWDDFKIGL